MLAIWRCVSPSIPDHIYRYGPVWTATRITFHFGRPLFEPLLEINVKLVAPSCIVSTTSMTKGSTLYAATSIAPTHKSNVDIDRPPQLFVDRGAVLPAPLQYK